jgi:hypothetical protein
VELGEFFPEVIDTSAEPVHRESLSLHPEEPAQQNQIGVRIFWTPTAFCLSRSGNEIGASIIIEESETDLFISAC